MPAPPRPNPPRDVAHIAIGGDFGGVGRWINTFWLRNGAQQQPLQADLQALLGDFITDFTQNFRPYMSVTTKITDGTLLYYGVAGEAAGAEATTAGDGSSAADPLPANVALCISWSLQQRYRGGHPRTYLGGIAEDERASALRWKDTTAAAVANSANNFQAGVESRSHGDFSDIHLGTVSFVHQRAWRNPPVFRDFIPGAAHVDTRIDSMRRRLGHDIA